MTDKSKLGRDEVQFPDGTKKAVKADAIWIEFKEPIETNGPNKLEGCYRIRDIVTDAVNVEVLDAEPLEDEVIDGVTADYVVADYELHEFRANTKSGEIVPENKVKEVLPELSIPDADRETIEQILTGDD